MLPNRLRLPVEMLAQPDEISCGPTCLHAIYRYWGEQESLSEVVTRTERLEHGGTLAVFLACDALKKGYQATIYTYNLLVFDPTWFARPQPEIATCLQAQQQEKSDPRLPHASLVRTTRRMLYAVYLRDTLWSSLATTAFNALY
jgi:hypothetical protein